MIKFINNSIIKGEDYDKIYSEATKITNHLKINNSVDFVLQPGMVFCSEPKLWFPNEVYMRVEDMVLVTEDGARSLSQFDRELFEIKDNKLRVISLDGHRISIRKIKLKNNYPFMDQDIINIAFNEKTKLLDLKYNFLINQKKYQKTL